MRPLLLTSYISLTLAIAGCAGNTAPTLDVAEKSASPAPKSVAKIPPKKNIDLPERIASVPEPKKISAPEQRAVPETIDLGDYDASPPDFASTPSAIQTIASQPYETVSIDPIATAPQYVDVSQPPDIQSYQQPLPRGQMAPVRDDPLDGAPIVRRATTYNVAALKAAYQPSEALTVSAPPPRVRNTPTPAFGHELSQSALSRLNPNVAYVAAYKKIGYPWGDVPETTGVCTDVVIRSYRGLGIDLQSMVHEDMRQAFSAYPSRKIYGLREADPNIDHRRVVNLEAFFERVGAGIPVGSDYQPGDVITWRLSGGEPHIGVVVDRRDPKTGNPLIVHNLGAGVRAEDLLDYAPPHGAYRFSPDQQSRMASLALKRS